jgi:hypothetical protein
MPEVRYENLPVEQIHLDMANPRIAKWVEMYGQNPTAEQISLALGVGESQAEGGGTTFQSLKASIRTYGGIIHPILVNRYNDIFTVIEGNTRVAIFKEFKSKGVAGAWDTIPAIVHSDLSSENINAIRLQAHLVGPRAWDPYSKAKYLELLSNSKNLTIKQIVDYCGGKESEISNYIKAYYDMEKHYRPLCSSDDEFDPTRFSAFVELQKPRVLQAISGAGFGKNDFAQWVIDQKIHKNEAVRSLPQILTNPKSKDVFLKNGKRSAEMALRVLDVPAADVAIKDFSLSQLAHEIVKRIQTMSYPDFSSLKNNPDSDEVQSILDAKEELIQLCGDILSE